MDMLLGGNVTARGKQNRANYLSFYEHDFPLTIVESKDINHPVGDRLQQATEYAEAQAVKYVHAPEGDGFVEQDMNIGNIRNLSLESSLRHMSCIRVIWMEWT